MSLRLSAIARWWGFATVKPASTFEGADTRQLGARCLHQEAFMVVRAVSVAALAIATPAFADGHVATLMATRDATSDLMWPAVPDNHERTLEQQIRDRITDLGNGLGEQLGLLSRDLIALRCDGYGQRASLWLGGGTARTLKLQAESAWQLTDGAARIAVQLDVAIAGNELVVRLPDFELMQAPFDGRIEVVLPVVDYAF
jgi:hypothetical protein